MEVIEKIDIELINPKKSGKYSPNLYSFLKNIPHYQYIAKDNDGTLYIGYPDDIYFNGSRLLHVLCYGKKAQTWAYPIKFDLVDNFWDEYIANGRCAIDKDHEMYFMNDESRWNAQGDVRTCNWCNNCTQNLIKWVEPVQREMWKSVSVPL